ncbi:MAG: SdrD B-like domain-containing protein [Patescibacteria group bacterium]|nr:SdrD B-like domain-containing protein [Patescibacteria group bacterium]
MKRTLIKGINITAQLAMIFYFSGLSIFILPQVAHSASEEAVYKTATEVYKGEASLEDEGVKNEVQFCSPDNTPPVLATTTVGIPYADDFQSYTAGHLITDPWSQHYGVTVENYFGNKAAMLNGDNGCGADDEEMWITIDTTDFCGLTLEYDRGLGGFENDDYFYSEYSIDGTNWNTLESKHGNSNWTHKTYTLPAETYNISNLQIRFRIDVNSENDIAIVDNFSITGSDCTPYHIDGNKWNDENEDGIWNNGEPGLENWTIQLFEEGKMIGFTDTDPNGHYMFDDLAAGDYRVCEVLQPQWIQSYPGGSGCHDVSFGNRVVLTGQESYNFGNYEEAQPATIIAHKIVCENESMLPNWGGGGSDITADTAQNWVDSHEGCNFVEDWEFEWGYENVGDPGDNLIGPAGNGWNTFGPTGANGQATTEVEVDGHSYLWMREVLQDGYIPFTYHSGGSDVSAEFYCHTDVLNYDNYDRVDGVTPGGTYYCVGFNVMEEPERGSLKVIKEVIGGEAHAWNFGFRYDDGAYINPVEPDNYVLFEDLVPGNYTVEEVSLANYAEENGCIDIEVVPGEEPTECTITNTYVPTPTYKIEGYKFQDSNVNKIWDTPAEEGIPDWTIELYQGDTLLNSTMTGPDGKYMFSGLSAGDYRVCEDLSDANWVQTLPGNNSCYNVTVGPSPALTIAAVEAPIHYNFGNFEYGQITGYKYNDENSNAAWDVAESEKGLEGWTINLSTYCSTDLNDYDYTHDGQISLADFTMFGSYYGNKDLTVDLNNDGLVTKPDFECFSAAYGGTPVEQITIDTKVTDSNGNYVFSGLEPGTYYVNEEMKSNWTQTFPGDNQPVEKNLTSGAGITQNFGNYTPPAEKPEEEPVVNPVISLTLTDNVDKVAAGSEQIYVLTWKVSQAPVTDLKLSSLVPDNTTFVSAENSGLYNADAKLISWELGDKAADATGTVTYTVKSGTDTLDGTIVTASASLYGANAAEVTATDNTTITNVPILTLAKTVDAAGPVSPGSKVNYTVKVSNTGYATAQNVVVKDMLPGSLYFSDILGTTRTLVSGGTLAPGETLSLPYPATVKNDTVSGSYINSVVLTADNHQTLTANAPITVKAGVVKGEEAFPMLTLDKKVDVAFANPGQSVNYTVTITNHGSAPAVNLVLNDTLPSGFTFVDTGGNTRTWKLGELKPGESTNVTYAALIDDTVAVDAFYDNLASLTADNHENLTAKASLEVRAGAVLGESTEPELVATLPATGAGVEDYLILGFAMLMAGFAGARMVWSKQRGKA